MIGARSAAILLLLAAASLATVSENERRDVATAEDKLDQLSAEVIVQMMKNEIAQMQPQKPSYHKKYNGNQNRQYQSQSGGYNSRQHQSSNGGGYHRQNQGYNTGGYNSRHNQRQDTRGYDRNRQYEERRRQQQREEERRRLQRINQARAILKNPPNAGDTPPIKDSGGLPYFERFLETTLLNAMAKHIGRTYLFLRPQRDQMLTSNMITNSIGGNLRDHAESRTRQLTRGDTGLEVWINKTPCPGCARRLINTYDGIYNKPKFYVAMFYYYPPESDHNLDTEHEIAVEKECLAKMMYYGFKIYAWKWNTFQTFVSRNVADFVADIMKTTRFQAGQEKVKNRLADARAMVNDLHRRSPQARTPILRRWCV